MVCAAYSFHRAASIIGKKHLEEREFFASVFQVLDAFSVELILKAAIQVTTHQCPTNEHSLIKLFDMIPAKHHPEIFEICGELTPFDGKTMRWMLDKSANAFTQLRYAHELPRNDGKSPTLNYAMVGFILPTIAEFLHRREPKIVEEGKDCRGFWQEAYTLIGTEEGELFRLDLATGEILETHE